jgi:hypothetical protein
MRRTLLATSLLVAAAVATSGCVDDIIGVGIPDAPTGLYYQLEPSGDPDAPRGIVLRWDAVNDPNLDVYNVYSRGSANGAWGLRGSTTSTSFHDEGIPHLQYYVTAVTVDGAESDPSDFVEVDERLRLPAPLHLVSISLDGAIHLGWDDNAYQSAPTGFDYYRLYSSAYDLDNNLCGNDWVLEGTTVSPSFLVDGITNGRPRCFAVSAISIEGFESLWSGLRYDTPRPDGHNVILYTAAADAAQSGFRFFRDLNNDGLAARTELGLVGAASSGTNDLVLTDVSGTLYLTAQRANTQFQVYGTTAIASLTDIDWAPDSTAATPYARADISAVPLWGFVFRMNEGGPFYQYGAIRVSAVGTNYVIFDWSYQTDPGNPELITRR